MAITWATVLVLVIAAAAFAFGLWMLTLNHGWTVAFVTAEWHRRGRHQKAYALALDPLRPLRIYQLVIGTLSAGSLTLAISCAILLLATGPS